MTIRHRVFARMWGVAVIAHVAGNWRYGDILPELTVAGLVMALVGFVATAVIVVPRRWLMIVLAAIVPIGVFLELPDLSNHWLLAGFVSAAYFVTAGRWERFEPVARFIILAFYAFAAFSKLNTGFFDPVTSCGLHYVNEIVGELGGNPIAPASLLGTSAVWATALAEVSVPILLVARRTRPFGVLVGVALHGVMSLDPAQHFYAFTSVLLALFVLFLDDGFAERVEGVGAMLRPWVQSALRLAVVGLGVSVTLASVTALSPVTFWFLTQFSFAWWIPYLVLVAWGVVSSMRPVSLSWHVGPVGVVLVALVAVNGLTPYLELKTATAWNMYANLVTVDGESNHFIVRSTLPLRDGQKDLVTIVSSDDPGLQAYSDEDYLLPWPSLFTYLMDHPEVSVTYERAGERHQIEGVDEVLPVSVWWRILPYRAVHGTAPDRCQVGYLPAL